MSADPTILKDAAAYRRAVDGAMEQLYGASYSELVEMAPAMDQDGTLLSASLGRALAPAAFAKAFAKAHHLFAVADGVSEPGILNRHRAALVAFCADTVGWATGTDGRGYSEQDGHIHRLDVDTVSRGCGFEVAISETPQNGLHSVAGDFMSRVSPPEIAFSVLSRGMDIGDTLSCVPDVTRGMSSTEVPVSPGLARY